MVVVMSTPEAREDRVLSEQLGRVRVLTLNRPDKLNAADLDLHRRHLACWDDVAKDDTARAVVITGAGRGFCAGGDLDMLRESQADPELQAELSRIHRALLHRMLSLPKPIIAAVNGPAAGFGAELAALCDFVVMSRAADLSDPHVQLGIAPSPGCVLVWPLLTSHSVAKEILTTGRRVGGDEALRLGLVNRLAAPGEVLTAALELANELAALPPAGVIAAKEAFNRPLLEEIARLDGRDAW
jgi:enoyl-CoA hydratase